MALQPQHALLVDLGILVGNDRTCHDSIEHGVLLDQVLEDGPQLVGRELIAERFEILAWNIAKLSAATASLSVTRMLLTRISCTKGLGISSAEARIEDTATSVITAAAHLKRAQ